jgi:hypothetical protein
MGVGKTHTAHELAHRVPGSFVCDPELLGIGIQRMHPPQLRSWWQEYPLWRHGVKEIAHNVATGFERLLLMPGTLLEEAHHEEIVGGLIDLGHEVRHVTLLASPDTLLKRQRSRGQVEGSDAGARLDAHLQVLSQPTFATQVHTDGLQVSAVAEQIARLVGLQLGPSGNGVLLRRRSAHEGDQHPQFRARHAAVQWLNDHLHERLCQVPLRSGLPC